MAKLLMINTGRVVELAGAINTQHGIIKEVLGALRAINTDLSTAWSGPAQDTFELTYGDWIQQLDNYSETLANVKGYLESVAINFDELDDAARQAAAGAAMAS